MTEDSLKAGMAKCFFRLGEVFWHHRQIIAICGFGLLLRVGLALSIYYFAPLFGLNRLIAPDAINYYEPGALEQVLPALRGEIDPGSIFFYGRDGYIVWLGFVYFLFGHHPLIPILINCLLGTAAIGFIYFLAKKFFDHKVAILTSLLMSMTPSIIFWSALNLKESWVYLLVSVILLLYYLFEQKEDIFLLLPMGIAFLWLSCIRQYISIIVLGICIVSTPILFSRARKMVRFFGPLFLIGVMILVIFLNRAVWDKLILFIRPDYIKQFVKMTEIGGSSLGGFSFIERLFAFLFFPLPWKTVDVVQVMTIPEMIGWYLLFPFILVGLIGAVRVEFKKAFPILLLVVLLPLFYVFFFRNLGWVYRYKSFLMPYFFMFGAYGIRLFLNFSWVKHRWANAKWSRFLYG